jgi:hypothetical protein
MSMYLLDMLTYERRQAVVCGRSLCLHPCALSGPYRPRGAHGFLPILMHFSGKSASFDRKLSDRIVREFDHSRGLAILRSGGCRWELHLEGSSGKAICYSQLPFTVDPEKICHWARLGQLRWSGREEERSKERDGPLPLSYPMALPPSTRGLVERCVPWDVFITLIDPGARRTVLAHTRLLQTRRWLQLLRIASIWAGKKGGGNTIV